MENLIVKADTNDFATCSNHFLQTNNTIESNSSAKFLWWRWFSLNLVDGIGRNFDSKCYYEYEYPQSFFCETYDVIGPKYQIWSLLDLNSLNSTRISEIIQNILSFSVSQLQKKNENQDQGPMFCIEVAEHSV